ncbi:hypothetical protein Scep_023568 [Stephania cephalantha]|uniref:Uncharacterized protein n=1 Tax=Stephania cephalantha TaxID=152367 RepID=A0AAP0HSW9_9MAGN
MTNHGGGKVVPRWRKGGHGDGNAGHMATKPREPKAAKRGRGGAMLGRWRRCSREAIATPEEKTAQPATQSAVSSACVARGGESRRVAVDVDDDKRVDGNSDDGGEDCAAAAKANLRERGTRRMGFVLPFLCCDRSATMLKSVADRLSRDLSQPWREIYGGRNQRQICDNIQFVTMFVTNMSLNCCFLVNRDKRTI